MTDGTTRRKELMKLLQNEMRPLSGTELARHFGVSRQVIVQDIALLRATDRNILSTNKGYVLYHPEQEEERSRRILASHHDKERMQEELYLIVDNGGCVCDVVVEHEIYGQLSADLILKNRRDVNEFVKKMGGDFRPAVKCAYRRHSFPYGGGGIRRNPGLYRGTIAGTRILIRFISEFLIYYKETRKKTKSVQIYAII